MAIFVRHKIGTLLRLKRNFTHATIGIAYSFLFTSTLTGAFFVPINQNWHQAILTVIHTAHAWLHMYIVRQLALGICCIFTCLLLYRLTHRKDCQILTGTCAARKMSLLKRTQQLRFSDPNEYVSLIMVKR